MSRVPDLAPFQLMNLANDIHRERAAILDVVLNGMGSMTMRDQLSSSQIQKVLNLAGYRVQIGYLKALLKELGFPFNGSSCSAQQLLMKVKGYVNVQNYRQDTKSEAARKSLTAEQTEILAMKNQRGPGAVIEVVRDMFYRSGQTMHQLFKQATTKSVLDFKSFYQLI